MLGTTKLLAEHGEILTVEEAASVLRISRASAYEAARRWRATQRVPGLPVIQMGRRLLVPRTALEEMLARPGRLYRRPQDRRGGGVIWNDEHGSDRLCCSFVQGRRHV